VAIHDKHRLIVGFRRNNRAAPGDILVKFGGSLLLAIVLVKLFFPEV
jgi:hypothetical protein